MTKPDKHSINLITIEEQNEILKKAIFKMGKFIRQNPPALEGFLEDMQLLHILVGGNARDPEGKEYLEKWLYEAEQKVMTNKI